MLTKEQIIEIANKALIKEGTSLDIVKVEFDLDNRLWQEQLEYERQHNPEIAAGYEALLKNRSYQAVCYIPDMEKVLFMGRIFVFIEPNTGEVIAVGRGF